MEPLLVWQLVGALAFGIGVALGHPINLAIARLPEDRSLHAPSQCAYCPHQLSLWEQIPILGWIALRGRCRNCQRPIGVHQPLIELLSGVLTWLLFRRTIPDPTLLDGPHLLAFGVFTLFVALLVTQAYVDIRYYIIPDETSIYAVPVGIITAALLQWVAYPEAIGWQNAILGAVCGGGALFLIGAVASRIAGREAMGFGDVKLLAMIGSFLGPWALFSVVFTGSVMGAIFGAILLIKDRRRVSGIPFGPFLAFGAIAYLIHEHPFFNFF